MHTQTNHMITTPNAEMDVKKWKITHVSHILLKYKEFEKHRTKLKKFFITNKLTWDVETILGLNQETNKTKKFCNFRLTDEYLQFKTLKQKTVNQNDTPGGKIRGR